MPNSFESSPSLAIVMVCSDWRLYQPVVDMPARIARALGVDRLDFVALPGPDGLIKPERANEWNVAIAQVNLLIGAHKPVALALFGHQQCAGHPATDSQHEADSAEAARRLKDATNFPGKVSAFTLVHRTDTDWQIRPVAEF